MLYLYATFHWHADCITIDHARELSHWIIAKMTHWLPLIWISCGTDSTQIQSISLFFWGSTFHWAISTQFIAHIRLHSSRSADALAAFHCQVYFVQQTKLDTRDIFTSDSFTSKLLLSVIDHNQTFCGRLIWKIKRNERNFERKILFLFVWKLLWIFCNLPFSALFFLPFHQYWKIYFTFCSLTANMLVGIT